jgi:hypothetical protein
VKTYWFWIRRTRVAAFERISVLAANSYDAILALPECVSWNFSTGGGQ